MRRYLFLPVALDRWDRRPWHPEPGTVVVKCQPHGCPPNGTMRHSFIAEPDGRFLGLVLESSLVGLQDGALTRCRDCRAPSAVLARFASDGLLRPFCDRCADLYANLGAQIHAIPEGLGPAADHSEGRHRP
jgi:hypothetical protein